MRKFIILKATNSKYMPEYSCLLVYDQFLLHFSDKYMLWDESRNVAKLRAKLCVWLRPISKKN